MCVFICFVFFSIVSLPVYFISYLNTYGHSVHVSPAKMHRQRPRVLSLPATVLTSKSASPPEDCHCISGKPQTKEYLNLVTTVT